MLIRLHRKRKTAFIGRFFLCIHFSKYMPWVLERLSSAQKNTLHSRVLKHDVHLFVRFVHLFVRYLIRCRNRM